MFKNLKLSTKEFCKQFILFEGDDVIHAYETQIRAFVKAVPTGRASDVFSKEIIDLKTFLKLENAPLALLALVPKSDKREEAIYEAIKSVPNGLALMKWIERFKVHSSWTDTDHEAIMECIEELKWPENIPVIWEKTDSFKTKCFKVSEAVKKLKEKLKLANEPKVDKYGYPIKEAEKTNILIEDIENMDFIPILQAIRECYHIGGPALCKILRKKALTAGYVQPICFLEAILLLYEKVGKYSREPVLREVNDCLSEILEHQLIGLRKLEEECVMMLDGSGSMDCSVTYNGHNTIRRRDIAILWAMVFQKLCKKGHIYKTACYKDPYPTLGKMELPFNILDAIKMYKDLDLGCSGIYTYPAMVMLENKLKNEGIKPKVVMVFADSQDFTDKEMAYPILPAVRIAETQLLWNAEHSGTPIISTNQMWNAHIEGYSDYVVEYLWEERGISNPTAKSSDFNGTNYRVSF